MKKKAICFHIIFVLMFIAMSFSTATGITNGSPDGDDHPYVGLAVFDDGNGNPLWRCSGTLLSPTLFLTSGHCTEAPAVRATIWFEEDVESGIPGNGYPFSGPTSIDGTVYTHPEYDPNDYFLHDLGVVILDEAVDLDEYGILPELGILNPLKKRRGRQDVTFTAVGYGLQKINPVFVTAERVRLQATLMLVDIVGVAKFESGSYVKVSANVHTGGTCFGDSGGPLFLNDTNIVAAVVSSGLNGNCRGVSLEYRVDTADDLDWLYDEFGDLLP